MPLFFLLSIVAAFMLGRYATMDGGVALAQEARGPGGARMELAEMNRVLDSLIDNYENDLIGEAGLTRAIPALTGFKIRAMTHLPQIYGRRFDEWFVPFEFLDRRLDTANRIAQDVIAGETDRGSGKEVILEALREAKAEKEKVEKMLPAGKK